MPRFTRRGQYSEEDYEREPWRNREPEERVQPVSRPPQSYRWAMGLRILRVGLRRLYQGCYGVAGLTFAAFLADTLAGQWDARGVGFALAVVGGLSFLGLLFEVLEAAFFPGGDHEK